MKKILLLTALTVFSVFISCSKDDLTEPEKTKIEKTDDNQKDDSVVDGNTKTGKTGGKKNKDKPKKVQTKLEKKITGKWEVIKTKSPLKDITEPIKNITNPIKDILKNIIPIPPSLESITDKIPGINDEWIDIRKKAGQEVYILFSKDGNYNARIDIKNEFSGKGTYKSIDDTTIVVEGNVKATISNISFTDNNTIEADIEANGQSITIRAVRK